MRMHLTHTIALCPTPDQVDYFKRACGTARRVWNWALKLDENGRPWLRDIHRDAHAQPFAHLAKAWERFFTDLKAGKEAHAPRFKKKGRCRDSFYVANDKFRLVGKDDPPTQDRRSRHDRGTALRGQDFGRNGFSHRGSLVCGHTGRGA